MLIFNPQKKRATMNIIALLEQLAKNANHKKNAELIAMLPSHLKSAFNANNSDILKTHLSNNNHYANEVLVASLDFS
jgi:hypothetical protein